MTWAMVAVLLYACAPGLTGGEPAEGSLTKAMASLTHVDDICVTRSDQESDVTLDGKPAIQYTDTLCGPYGSTVIYLVHGPFGYRFTVEPGTDYQSIEGAIRPILDTFRIEER